MKEKKVACLICSAGKRACSGTFPCDRCKRLGKGCSYAEDVIRRGLVPGLGGGAAASSSGSAAGPGTSFLRPSSSEAGGESAEQQVRHTVSLQLGPAAAPQAASSYGGFGGFHFEAETAAAAVLAIAAAGPGRLPAAVSAPRQSFNTAVSAPSFSQPRPNRYSLPPQLFPWQDVRLYSCFERLEGQEQEGAVPYNEKTSAATSTSANSSTQRSSYLRYLYDSTLDAASVVPLGVPQSHAGVAEPSSSRPATHASQGLGLERKRMEQIKEAAPRCEDGKQGESEPQPEEDGEDEEGGGAGSSHLVLSSAVKGGKNKSRSSAVVPQEPLQAVGRKRKQPLPTAVDEVAVSASAAVIGIQEEDDDDEGHEDEEVAAAGTPPAPKRARADSHGSAIGISILAKTATAGLFDSPAATSLPLKGQGEVLPFVSMLPPPLRNPASHAPLGSKESGAKSFSQRQQEHEPAEREAEIAQAQALMKETEPAWLCIYDTHAEGSFGLKHCLFNRAAQLLFGITQAEVNLRVAFGKAIRWTHPEEVLQRAVLAVQARKEQLALQTIERGRYLSRRVRGVQRVPETALITIAKAARFGVVEAASTEGDTNKDRDKGKDRLQLPSLAPSLSRAGSSLSQISGVAPSAVVLTGLQVKERLIKEAAGSAAAAAVVAAEAPPMPTGNPPFRSSSSSASSAVMSGAGASVAGGGGLSRSASSLGPGQPIAFSYSGYDSLVTATKTNLAMKVAVQLVQQGQQAQNSTDPQRQQHQQQQPPQPHLSVLEAAFRGGDSRVEADDLRLALEELDDALVYSVFEADEEVTHFYSHAHSEDKQGGANRQAPSDSDSDSDMDDDDDGHSISSSSSSSLSCSSDNGPDDSETSGDEDDQKRPPRGTRAACRNSRSRSKQAEFFAPPPPLPAPLHMTVTRFRLRGSESGDAGTDAGGAQSGPPGYRKAHQELLKALRQEQGGTQEAAMVTDTEEEEEDESDDGDDDDADDEDDAEESAGADESDSKPKSPSKAARRGGSSRKGKVAALGSSELRLAAIDIELEQDIALDEDELEARLREAREKEQLLRASECASLSSSSSSSVSGAQHRSFIGGAAVPTAVPVPVVGEAAYGQPHPYYHPLPSLLVKGQPPGYYSLHHGPQLLSASLASLPRPQPVEGVMDEDRAAAMGNNAHRHPHPHHQLPQAIPITALAAALPPGLVPMPFGRVGSGMVHGSTWLLAQHPAPSGAFVGESQAMLEEVEARSQSVAKGVLSSPAPASAPAPVPVPARGPGARGGASIAAAEPVNAKNSRRKGKTIDKGDQEIEAGGSTVKPDIKLVELPPPQFRGRIEDNADVFQGRIEGLDTTRSDTKEVAGGGGGGGGGGGMGEGANGGFVPSALPVLRGPRIDSSLDPFGLGPLPPSSSPQHFPGQLQQQEAGGAGLGAAGAGGWQLSVGLGEPLVAFPVRSVQQQQGGQGQGAAGDVQRLPSFSLQNHHHHHFLSSSVFSLGVGGPAFAQIPVAMPASVALAGPSSSSWLMPSTSSADVAAAAAPTGAGKGKMTTKPPVFAAVEED